MNTPAEIVYSAHKYTNYVGSAMHCDGTLKIRSHNNVTAELDKTDKRRLYCDGHWLHRDINSLPGSQAVPKKYFCTFVPVRAKSVSLLFDWCSGLYCHVDILGSNPDQGEIYVENPVSRARPAYSDRIFTWLKVKRRGRDWPSPLNAGPWNGSSLTLSTPMATEPMDAYLLPFLLISCKVCPVLTYLAVY